MEIKSSFDKNFLLFKQLKHGTPAEKQRARNELTIRYEGLVYKISNELYQRYRPIIGSAIDRDDLVQEGMLGLMRALQTFDYTKGAFVVYVSRSIHVYIFRIVRDKASFMGIPANIQEEFRKINQITDSLRVNLEREPRKEEVAKVLGVTVGHVEEIIQRVKTCREVSSLEGTVDWGKDSKMSLQEVISSNEETPEKIVVKNAVLSEVQEKVRGILGLGLISAREKYFLERFFGLFGRKRENLAGIGGREGITRERVRQVIEKALSKLRASKLVEIVKLEPRFQETKSASQKNKYRSSAILNLLQSTKHAYKEIGEILNIPKYTVENVARWAKFDGVSRARKHRKERSEYIRRRVLEEILKNPQMVYREIGELLNLHKYTVAKIARVVGIKQPKGKRSSKLTTRNKKMLAIAQGNLNLTYRKIGQMFDLSTSHTTKILLEQGFYRSNGKQVRNQKILRTLQDNPQQSYAKVGKIFGLTPMAIKYIAIKGGVLHRKTQMRLNRAE